MPRVLQLSDSQLNGAVYRKESVSARDGPDDYTYYGGLRFDSYDINLTATLPDKPLRFVPSPTFDKIDLIVYRPKSSDDIAITVRLAATVKWWSGHSEIATNAHLVLSRVILTLDLLHPTS